LGAAFVTGAEPAAACGGCFVQASADSFVTGHRMVFAVSEDRTVLWDQIQYTGAPDEFGWVLPVKRGAYIEASTDAWFEALDAATRTTVVSPWLACSPRFSDDDTRGCGCRYGSDNK